MSQVPQSVVVDSRKPIKSWPAEVRKMPPDSSSSLCNQLDFALRIYMQFSNVTTSHFPANTHRRLHISGALLQSGWSYPFKSANFNVNWLARRWFGLPVDPLFPYFMLRWLHSWAYIYCRRLWDVIPNSARPDTTSAGHFRLEYNLFLH